MKKEKNIITFKCDVCGVEIDGYEELGQVNLMMRVNGDVSFEDNIEGDYCKDCGEKLGNLISTLLTNNKISERYNSDTSTIKEVIDFLELKK